MCGAAAGNRHMLRCQLAPAAGLQRAMAKTSRIPDAIPTVPLRQLLALACALAAVLPAAAQGAGQTEPGGALAAIKKDVKMELKAELKIELKTELKGELMEELRTELGAELRTEIREELMAGAARDQTAAVDLQENARAPGERQPQQQPPPPPPPPPPPWKTEEEMEMANSWPWRPCACEASISIIKADMHIMKADHQALKLRADRTESKFADLFAGLLAQEWNAALFEQAIAGERRRAQADSCRGQSLVVRVGEINAACCSGTNDSGHRLLQDETGGSGGSESACDRLPKQCSTTCAPIFIAFREECEEMMEEAAFNMQQVERLYESCLEQVSVDEGSCGAQIGRRILQRVDSSHDTVSNSGATTAMIIPLTIVTNSQTGLLEVLGQTGRRRSLQHGAEAVQEFRCECGSSADISTCIPVCDESIHGFELLLTIDQSDLRVSCKLHFGLYSWAGAVSEGSYFGDDVKLFMSMLVSGAGGRYILKLRVSPNVGTLVTIQLNQEVHISGDRALPSAPRWGTGALEIEEGGSLALDYIALIGGADYSDASARLTVRTGGRLSVVDSQMVPAGAGDSWLQPIPLPCDGATDGMCRGPHAAPVVVEMAASVSLAVPLVCGFWTEDCMALRAGVTVEQRTAGLANNIPWNAHPICFTGDYVTVPDDPHLSTNYSGTWGDFRCDAAEGFTDNTGIQGHGPFGLEQRGTGWYRLPAGKGLPTAPHARIGSCGGWDTGWLTGWSGADRPDKHYSTPADGSLPPPVGHRPAAGLMCFEGPPKLGTCYDTPVTIYALSCGRFALWELPPASICHQLYCMSNDPCESCATAGRCATESWVNTYDEHYELHTDLMTWEDAEAVCQAAGQHLASVQNEGDLKALRKLAVDALTAHGGTIPGSAGIPASASPMGEELIWIGMTGRQNSSGEFEFIWSDGSSQTERFFNYGEPNDRNGEEASCVSQVGFGWNGDSCQRLLPFACETDSGKHKFDPSFPLFHPRREIFDRPPP